MGFHNWLRILINQIANDLGFASRNWMNQIGKAKEELRMGERCSKKMSSILYISLVLHCCLIKSPWNSWLNRNLSSHANNTNLSSHLSVGHKLWLAGLVLHLISQSQDQGVLMLSFYGEVLKSYFPKPIQVVGPVLDLVILWLMFPLPQWNVSQGSVIAFRDCLYSFELSIWQPYSNEGSNSLTLQYFQQPFYQIFATEFLCFPLLL